MALIKQMHLLLVWCECWQLSMLELFSRYESLGVETVGQTMNIGKGYQKRSSVISKCIGYRLIQVNTGTIRRPLRSPRYIRCSHDVLSRIVYFEARWKPHIYLIEAETIHLISNSYFHY